MNAKIEKNNTKNTESINQTRNMSYKIRIAL